MKRAFSLIEVMVAVVILSVVLMAVLTLSSSSFKINQSVSKKSEIFFPLATVALHQNIDYSNTHKTLEDFTKNSYRIDSDRLKEVLKSHEIFYLQEELDLMDLIPEGSVDVTQMPQVRIIEHSIKSGEIGSRIYTLKIENSLNN